MLEKEIREVAETAKKQMAGGYTVESDAIVALVLVQKLALAMVGEALPPPVVSEQQISGNSGG